MCSGEERHKSDFVLHVWIISSMSFLALPKQGGISLCGHCRFVKSPPCPVAGLAIPLHLWQPFSKRASCQKEEGKQRSVQLILTPLCSLPSSSRLCLIFVFQAGDRRWVWQRLHPGVEGEYGQGRLLVSQVNFLFLCWNRVTHTPGRPQTQSVAKHDLELLIILHYFPSVPSVLSIPSTHTANLYRHIYLAQCWGSASRPPAC